jgi:hypothetical protein
VRRHVNLALLEGLYLYEMSLALAAKKNGGFDPNTFLGDHWGGQEDTVR